MSLQDILGTELRQQAETVTLSAAISESVKYVGIYFGAHWAPPCRLFTETLSGFYEKVNKDGVKLQVVFCSTDGNEAAFERNYAKMAWAAVPYNDEERAQSLRQRYGINGIPTLVIIDTNGNLVSYEGRNEIQTHQDGAMEHWDKQVTQTPTEQ